MYTPAEEQGIPVKSNVPPQPGEASRRIPELLTRYGKQIQGILSCYDRVVMYGTLPGICYAQGMTAHLQRLGFRIFDYPQWAEPLNEQLRANAEQLAKEYGLTIEHVRKAKTRKEDLVAKVLEKRGRMPGLVHILSAMEGCQSYQPWHDKKSGKTYLKPKQGRCLHYYFYFIDEELGLCYVRVPTWAPFRIQVYFNGHQWLAQKLRQQGIAHVLRDNAFIQIDDFGKAQELADAFDVSRLHARLDRMAKQYCPVIEALGIKYHFSLMQVEYATDIVFRRQSDLAPLYQSLVRTAVHAVKPDQIATFLGRKLTGNYQEEVGNNFNTRIEGTRIRHQMGPVSIKMYDKFGLILRIETTANDVTFFKHHRKVEQRDGTVVYKLAPLKKSIYSLDPDLRTLLYAANRRYLEFLSDLEDPSSGITALQTLSEKSTDANGRTHKGLNFFDANDQAALQTLARGEFAISGLRHREMRKHLPDRSPAQISSLLKRFRTHGMIRRIGRSYKYHLTSFGRRVALAGLKLKELVVIPMLATPVAA